MTNLPSPALMPYFWKKTRPTSPPHDPLTPRSPFHDQNNTMPTSERTVAGHDEKAAACAKRHGRRRSPPWVSKKRLGQSPNNRNAPASRQNSKNARPTHVSPLQNLCCRQLYPPQPYKNHTQSRRLFFNKFQWIKKKDARDLLVEVKGRQLGY